MGKRFTIVAVTAVAVLLAGIAFAVSRLYAPVKGESAKQVPQGWSVLKAVPSDAVAIMVFDGSAKAAKVLADSTGLLKAAIDPESKELMAFLQGLGRSKMAVSLHNSGSLVPLIAAELPEADSITRVKAEKAGLKIKEQDGFVIASKSETFVNASARNLKEGTSVMGSTSLQNLLTKVGGPAILLINHSHAPKITDVYGSSKMRRKAGTIKDLAPWSAWTLAIPEKESISIKGVSNQGDAAGSWFKAFNGKGDQEALYAEALPYFTASAISLPVEDINATIQAQRAYADGIGRLNAFSKALKARPCKDLTTEEWLRSLQPKEFVKASFRADDGVKHSVILVRSSKDLKAGKETKNPYSGCLADVFGEVFNVPDSVCSTVNSKWTVFGDTPSVQAFQDKDFLQYTLKDRMADASVQQPKGFTAYASLGDEPAIISDVFSSRLGGRIEAFAKGAGYAPAIIAVNLAGSNPEITVKVEKRALKGTKVQVLERDTTVVVPTGYFPVKNHTTGKINHLYQNSHGAICLNDENGKGVWGIPFKGTLCGRVQSIDYFHNGKLQYLFASGNKLYLIDRLSHWVNGFPVSLPKEVLLGPDVYDFTGAGGYTVMVLHKDNTLERYNLHGKQPEGWKGIKAPETVKNLPELIEFKDKHYWAVRTSVRTLVYPFEGGEPIIKDDGGKMIKPDAKLTLTSKGISAECYDGKERDFKLN